MHIKLENLTKSFEDSLVLDNVNFDDEVSTLAIIGPSGGGKSTLLRILGGLLTPTEGTVALDGQPVTYSEQSLPAYRANLGFVFQDSGLFHHIDARENITLPLRAVHGYTAEKADKHADDLLERFNLKQEAHKFPRQLSGGQQQRVAIARAVAARPKLLLLDEPTSALDPEYTGEVLNLLRDLKEAGTRFVVVTHEMGFARHACDKIAFLYGGRLLEYGESADVFDNPSTSELSRFLGKLLQWNV